MSQAEMNPKVLCARLAWTAIATPLIHIFTDQPPHVGGFPLVSICCFSNVHPSDAAGTGSPTPVRGSARAAAEKKEFAGYSGLAPVLRVSTTSCGAEMAMWGKAGLCRGWLPRSWGRRVSKIHR